MGIDIVRQDWDRISSCQGKVAYDTNAQAAQAKRKMKGGRVLEIYRCRYCSSFHLATKRGGKR